MNREMWSHPATQRNIEQLRADGATVLDVGAGDQACGETGDGRMLEPDELLYDLIRFFTPKVLAGQHVLVSAGPTFEAIDPVRGLTNLSSGKMGFAIARAAHEAGAQVTLVAGPVSLPTPRGVGRVNVKSALNMQKSLDHLAPGRHGVHLGRGRGRLAPGADAGPEDQEGRLGRGAHAVVRGEPRHPGRHCGQRRARRAARCTAWASPPRATTCWPTPRPSARARACRCWWATSGPTPSGRTTTRLLLVDEDGTLELPRASKLVLARQLVAEIARRLHS